MANVTSQLAKPPIQPFVLPGRYSWADFQTLEGIIRQDSKLRITYLDGVIELMPTGEEHESIKSMLGFLIEFYFFKQGIEFIPVGSATQASETEAVSFEPDESYYLGAKKEHPDLAIEVNITSGGPEKLEKYQRLEIQEVWMWSDQRISIYSLEGNGYTTCTRSRLLPNLDIGLLELCVILPSRLEAIKSFSGDN